MATSDYEQRTINVPQHKRLAQGEKLDGTSLEPKGGTQHKAPSKPHGGLSALKKQK
jgi:hypothetical protein